jgi:hypothetical protein
LSNGLCIFEVENCSTYDSDGVCTACTGARYLNSAGDTCVACMSDCTTCAWTNSAEVCSVCTDSNFVLKTDGSLCAPVIANCDTQAAATPEVCTACASNYIKSVSDTLCWPPLPNCDTRASDVTKCVQCESNYFVSSSGSACYDCDHSTEGIDDCSACTDGNTLTCTSCSGSANLKSDGSECITCIAGTNFVNDVCEVDCATIGNCAACSLTGNTVSCSDCYGDRIPSADGAGCITNTVAHCTAYDSDKKCTACKNGYFFDEPEEEDSDDSSVTTTDDSEEEDEDPKCTICSTLTQRCLECTADACTKCGPPYILKTVVNGEDSSNIITTVICEMDVTQFKNA